MKKINFLIILVLALYFPLGAFALSTPTVDPVPSQVDANFYTLRIHAPAGSTVTAVGGPSQIAPVTDGAGSDELDGVVEVMVGLAQEQSNVFSIMASLDGEFSDSVTVTINETSAGQEPSSGDTTPPEAPIFDPIENPVVAYEYTITGSAEANANIYAKRPDGSLAGSTQANSNGLFSVTVELEIGKTNRLNVSAEDAAYNVSPSTQAVIQAVQPDYPPEEGEEDGEEEGIIPEGHPFTDIVGHWGEDYIRQIYEREIVSGKTATLFDPNVNITRAELTKIAVIAFEVAGIELPQYPFDDVAEEAWYYPNISIARNAEVIEGYPDNTFRPNNPITRAAALKILLEAAGLEVGAGEASFPDISADAWFAPYVAYAQTNNIVGGYSDGTFGPGNFITRAEVAKIVVKILGSIN